MKTKLILCLQPISKEGIALDICAEELMRMNKKQISEYLPLIIEEELSDNLDRYTDKIYSLTH